MQTQTHKAKQNLGPTRLGVSAVQRWFSALASFFASLVAIVCPLCIPALGSLLASAGLGFAVSTTFLQPLLVALLLISIGSLAWSARLHGRWWIVASGLLGAALIYGGRYIQFNQPMMWSGAAILIGTSIANFKIKRGCARC